MTDHISLCKECNCMTKTIHVTLGIFYCGKCHKRKDVTIEEYMNQKQGKKYQISMGKKKARSVTGVLWINDYNYKEVQKLMGTLRQEAQAYEPQQTKNIADLDVVPIDDYDLKDGTGTDDKGEPYQYKYFVYDNVQYRVPSSVLGEIKKIIRLKPEITKVKVKRQGSGLSTRYEVEPLV